MAYIKKLDEVLTNQEIKNKATYLIAKWNIVDIDSLDTFYKTFMEINTNNIFRNKISSIYSKLKDLNKVKAISSFKFLNNNQDTITLNDYKGKLIYMDIWASSCKPCIEEFPSFNELVEKFSAKNVSFVGINIWDSEENWRRQLKKYGLKGIQLKLLSKNQFENDFLSEININSIPRYLILDSFGNILDFNADVPSSKKVNQELSDLLEGNNS